MARSPVLEPTTGKLVYVDDVDLQAAVDQGYSPATPADVQLEKTKAEYGTIPNQIGAAVTGLASGATLGLSDVALAQLGAGEALKAYDQLYPTTRTVGQLAGAIAPVVLSGGAAAPEAGAGIAARVASATPAALAQAAGEAAVARLGLAEAAGVAQGVGKTAARWATQAGVESALQGIGQETARLAIDNELSGEKIGQIAAAGLTSGLTGAGIGAGLGALGGGLKRTFTRVGSAVEDAANGPIQATAPDGIRQSSWDSFRVRALEWSAKVRGVQDPTFAKEYLLANAARKMGQDAQEEFAQAISVGLPARTVVTNAGDVVEAAATKPPVELAKIIDDAAAQANAFQAKIVKAADDEIEAANVLRQLNSNIGKSNQNIRKNLDDFIVGEELADLATRSSSIKADTLVSKNIDSTQLARQRAGVENLLLELDDRIRTVKADEALYGKAQVKSLENLYKRVEKKFYEIVELPIEQQPVELFKLADRDFKSSLGNITKNVARYAKSDEARNTGELLKEFYKIPQTLLEDVELWGNAANVQREINKRITQSIGLKRAFRNDWYESVGRRKNPADPWAEWLPVSDPGKIESIAKEAVSDIGSTKEVTLGDYITQKREYYQLLKEYGDFAGKPRLLDSIDGQLKRLETIEQQFQDLKKLQKEIDFEDPKGNGFSRLVAAVPEGAGGGLLRSIANATILNPRLLAAGYKTGGDGVERIAENLAQSQTRSISNKVASAARAVADGAVTVAERAPTVGTAVVRFNERSKRVKDLAMQTGAVRQRLEQETSWMADQVPRAREAAIQTGLRQIDYLHRNLPTGVAATTPFSAPLPPTRQQVHGWLTRLKAVENPGSILDDLAAGKLTPEAVDAVRTVYPETFADILSQMVQRLSALQSKKKAPKYAQRVQLGLLLGIPADPTMTPDVMQAIQGQYAAQPDAVREGSAGAPAPRRGQKAPDIANAYRSGSEETELTSEAT